VDNDVTPLTLLVAEWAARDDLYSRQPQTLGVAAIRAIRNGRVTEAKALIQGQADRMTAIQRARHWWPPEHGR
jgi:hypothetical protein